MAIINITATDIPDAWFQAIWSILEHGHKYTVEKGSYEGQTRLECDWITIEVKRPYQEPYDQMLPQIPEHLGVPNPVAPGYIEEYVPKLMTSEIDINETYTYGERLCKVFDDAHGSEFLSQIDHNIKVLKNTPNTNQAILQVAQPEDCMLSDPPCLRHIDLRVRNKKLIMYPYFRSWDLWGGLPANLAVIAVLQKYMADEIGVTSGSIRAMSKGLHLYSYAEKLAKIRTNRGSL